MSNTYEARNKVSKKPENDFYQTPKCVTWELINNYLGDFNRDISILDPCCGLYAIGNELKKYGFTNITEKDLIYGDNFLLDNNDSNYGCIVMNPPFKDFDAFVTKAKEKAQIICSIGRLNFFGAHKRNINGLWSNLKYILVFDRQIAYDKPFREDGKVECGMLISCWFIWDKTFVGSPMLSVVDMQKYIVSKKDDENKEELW